MPVQKKEMTVRGTAFTFLSILWTHCLTFNQQNENHTMKGGISVQKKLYTPCQIKMTTQSMMTRCDLIKSNT